jgi:hypothetical protein
VFDKTLEKRGKNMSYWLKNLFFCCFRRKSPNPFGTSSNESSTTVLAGAANPSKTTANTSSVGANTGTNTGANTGASAQEAVSKNPFGTPEESPEKGKLLKGIVNCSGAARSVVQVC